MPAKSRMPFSPTRREPFSLLTNLPQLIRPANGRRMTMFAEPPLDAVVPAPILLGLPGQEDTASESSGDSLRSKVMTWYEGVVPDATANCAASPPPELAEFHFPPMEYDNEGTEADPMIDAILGATPYQPLDDGELPSRNSNIISLKAVESMKLSVDWELSGGRCSPTIATNFIPLPTFIIRLYDAVGDRCLQPQTDGFMYYDPGAASLNDTIERRGVAVPYDDPILNDPSCFADHAVSVFVEVPMLPGMGVQAHGPQVKYLGNFYLHKTERTLGKEDWKDVSEDIKKTLVDRYCENHTQPLDDPNPGSRYSTKNVRRWYDLGNVIPLVILQYVQRPQVNMVESPVEEARFDNSEAISFLDMDSDSESNYSRSGHSEVAEPKLDQEDSDGLNAYFRFPDISLEEVQAGAETETSATQLPDAVVSTLMMPETTEFQAAQFFAQMLEIRWNDGKTYWKLLKLLWARSDDNEAADDEDEGESEPNPWSAWAGFGLGPGPGVASGL